MTKRFYKDVAAVEAEGGFAVTLDTRTIKTPAGSALTLPTHALADAVAGEWDAQGDEVDPKSMPLMQLSGTAIDRVPNVRDGLIEGILRYADTDLLCYRADHPDDLIASQNATWQPLLEWADDTFGAKFKVVTGIIPVEQNVKVCEALRSSLVKLDDWTLTALGELVGISGSIIVGLAVLKGRIDAEQALLACQLDEDYQNGRWGKDAEALARRKNIQADLVTTTRFLELLSA